MHGAGNKLEGPSSRPREDTASLISGLGIPLGATGAILLGTALDELERRNKETALIVLCTAGDQGVADRGECDEGDLPLPGSYESLGAPRPESVLKKGFALMTHDAAALGSWGRGRERALGSPDGRRRMHQVSGQSLKTAS